MSARRFSTRDMTRIFALDKGLFHEGMKLNDTRQVSVHDFIELGRRMDLPYQLVIQEINRFASRSSNADAMIERSFLSSELKKIYLLGMHHRQAMIRQE